MDWYAGIFAGAGGKEAGAVNCAQAEETETNISSNTDALSFEYLISDLRAVMLEAPSPWLLKPGSNVLVWVVVTLAKSAGMLVGRLSTQQVFQEGWQRGTAILSRGWNVHVVIKGLTGVLGIFHDRIAIGRNGLSVRRSQLRMVERSRLCHGARIGKAVAQEIHEVLFLLQRKPQQTDVRIHDVQVSHGVEIAAAVVKLHYLLQCELAAVVTIRRGQSDVAQLRRFEEGLPGDGVTAAQGRLRDSIPGATGNHEDLRRVVAN